MSVRVMQWVWEKSQSKGTDRLVLLAIADCASDDGGNAYPSTATLVAKTGLGERTVQDAMKRLHKLNELAIYRNAGPKGCNRYRVQMQGGAATAPPQEPHPADPAPGAATAPQPPQIPHPGGAATAPRTVLEPSINHQKSKPSSSEIAPRSDVEQVCRHLVEKRIEYGLRRLTVTDAWRVAARLMIDKEGRTVAQIIGAIDWALNDDFWRTNIESIPTLRKQYEKLLGQAQRQRKQSSPQNRGYVQVNGTLLKEGTATNLSLVDQLRAMDSQRNQPAIEGAA